MWKFNNTAIRTTTTVQKTTQAHSKSVRKSSAPACRHLHQQSVCLYIILVYVLFCSSVAGHTKKEKITQ